MAYRIALIDADNTLLDFTKSEHEALCDCLRKRGLPTHREITDRYAKINDDHWKMLERGEVTREFLRINRFAQLFDEYGYKADPHQMADDYMAALSTKSYLMEGALDFCRALYGKCRMFIITNGNTSVQKGRFDPCPLAPMFEACFISEQMGCAKPEKRFFDAVAAMIADYTPEDTLVVGDSLSSDIQGGINAGLDTCWFNPNGKINTSHIAPTYTASHFDDIKNIILN
ncbi:MAG: noncanonical pyrimidine nucleotidase, YjjG family [Ruminococcaceae bacterium]|nr:noncanonical pyrimidine nucleotidase, YjjG family [Oscillospiraceae bacterium]